MQTQAIRPIDQALLRRELSAAYAAGTLEPAMQLLVETQILLSPEAEAEALEAEAVAAAMFEQDAAAPLAADSFEGVWARVREPAPAREEPAASGLPEAARRAGAMIDEILTLPHPLQDLALSAIGRGGWTFAGPGLRALPLPIGGPARAEVLRIEPGWGAPRHDHDGGEFTLILAGAFQDEHAAYHVGDISYAFPGMRHRPIAAPGRVCYAFAVSEGGPRFTGPLGLLQRIWPH